MKWKLVPIEPTKDMIYAGSRRTGYPEIYKAMLAAAPQPDYDAIKIFPNFKDFEGEIVFNLIKPNVDGYGAET